MANRYQLFTKYSKNWTLVRPLFVDVDNGLKEIGEFKEAVVCPLCNYILEKQALEVSDHDKQLTIEHVPPESLGGRGTILLCKGCNNTTGHTIDKALLEFYQVLPFNKKEEGASIEVVGELISKGKTIGARLTLQRQAKNKWFMKFKIKEQGDDYRKKVLQEAGADFKLKITGKEPSRKHVQIGLLKIAYLKAFETFGHSFLLAGDYSNIRKQILNPNDHILATYGVINTTDIPFDVGIYVIPQPVDLKGFMVVFEVEHNGKRDKNAVLLPPPSTNDKLYYLEVFKYERREFQIHDWRKFIDVDFLHDSEFVTAPIIEFIREYKLSSDYWKRF